MFLLEIYLEQYYRFSLTKICYIKQSLFTDTVVLHILPSMCKENNNILGLCAPVHPYFNETFKKLNINMSMDTGLIVLEEETVFIMPYFPSRNICLYMNNDYPNLFMPL